MQARIHRKRRVEIAGEEVKTLLGTDPSNLKDAWRRLKVSYKAAVKVRCRPLELRSSGSRWSGLTYTDTYHPREITSR